jgi:hypothetical protein
LTNISRSYEGSRNPPGEKGILQSEAKFEELADVMYFWALAEAYLQHPQMQYDMRWPTLDINIERPSAPEKWMLYSTFIELRTESKRGRKIAWHYERAKIRQIYPLSSGWASDLSADPNPSSYKQVLNVRKFL